MFQFSTRVQYGLEIMEVLAHSPEGYSSVSGLASQTRRSAGYLQQIIKPLKQAGLIKSKEGVGGGIKLAKRPEDVTLYEVLKALDGEVQPMSCLAAGHECPASQTCGHRKYWSQITNLLEEQFKKTTLVDLK
ncbi:MAG: Rrf2 family transcriptional regulator [Candidatus Komeilibacteria bacterium]